MSHRYMAPQALGQQSGVALISMLLVFGLVVILIGGAIARTSIDIKKTGYHLQYSQAYQYALGGEALARVYLHNDWQDDQEQKKGDHLNEMWAQPFQFEPDGGHMRIQIRDLNGRFNLNNLVDESGKTNQVSLDYFRRLLQRLDLPNQSAMSIVDWIDKDSSPQGARSEDVFYQSADYPYRSANQTIAHPSELVAIEAFEESDQLETLKNQISVLPERATNINPNTADQTVLASLHKNIKAEEIMNARDSLDHGFTSNEAFLEHNATAGVDLGAINFDVHSDYFEVWVVAKFEDQLVYLRSVIHRAAETGIMRTLYRDQSRNHQENPLFNQAIDSRRASQPEGNS